MKKKRKYFKSKFMFNHRRNHPAWVFDEDKDSYDFVGITHAKITDYQKNIDLPINPDKEDKRTSRIRPLPLKDKKKVFSKNKKNLEMHKKNRKIFYRVKSKKK